MTIPRVQVWPFTVVAAFAKSELVTRPVAVNEELTDKPPVRLAASAVEIVVPLSLRPEAVTAPVPSRNFVTALVVIVPNPGKPNPLRLVPLSVNE